MHELAVCLSLLWCAAHAGTLELSLTMGIFHVHSCHRRRVLDLVAALQLMLAFRHEICFIALNAQRNSLCRVFSASLCFPLGVRAAPSLSLFSLYMAFCLSLFLIFHNYAAADMTFLFPSTLISLHFSHDFET